MWDTADKMDKFVGWSSEFSYGVYAQKAIDELIEFEII
jgi:hypothetical protein